MKLVTLGIKEKMNLIVWFPFLIQLCIQHKLIPYQIKTVPVLTVDQIPSYRGLKVIKLYIGLNMKKLMFL